jgi:biopolymer transport protein ExbD
MAFKRKEKKQLYTGLQLTSLIDCFSILIVYLLMVTSLGQNVVEVPAGMTFPKATQGSEAEPSLIVEVRGTQYSIDGKILSMSSLVSELKRRATSNTSGEQNKSLIIQADQKTQYADINPLITAGLVAGYQQVGFAVLRESDQ